MRYRLLGIATLALAAVAFATPARQLVTSRVCALMGGATCESSGASAAHAPDPTMSLVCERSCAAKVPYRQDQIVSQPGARPGDLARCPVSGVVFAVHQESPTFTVRGKTYRTCCETCVTKLRKNPARFLAL